MEMKQLGNLAVVAARHKECLLQTHNDKATLFVGQGSSRRSISCDVWDDVYIEQIIKVLNFGEYVA